MKAKQLLRIRIKPSRPAFIYVFWITPGGTVETNFPWKPGPSEEFRCDELAVEQEQRLASLDLPLTLVTRRSCHKGARRCWAVLRWRSQRRTQLAVSILGLTRSICRMPYPYAHAE